MVKCQKEKRIMKSAEKGCQPTVRREHRKVKGKEGNISKKQGSTRFDKTGGNLQDQIT